MSFRYFKYLLQPTLAIAITGALTAPAWATPVTGSANFAGNVNVSAIGIQFLPTFTSTLGAQETGDFAGLVNGTIMSLTGGPVTGTTFIPQFATFTAGLASPIYFDLTYIAPGVGTVAGCGSAAIGSACTPAGSPFSLFQISPNTVLAALQFNGVFYQGSSSTGVSMGTTVFSTQTVASGTIPELVAMLNSGGSLEGITYSASLVATPPAVPEPSSLSILGLGLVAAGLFARRAKRP